MNDIQIFVNCPEKNINYLADVINSHIKGKYVIRDINEDEIKYVYDNELIDSIISCNIFDGIEDDVDLELYDFVISSRYILRKGFSVEKMENMLNDFSQNIAKALADERISGLMMLNLAKKISEF
ncbi:MAG: hypothetical protein QM758_13810 [Armatimonas sp.]